MRSITLARCCAQRNKWDQLNDDFSFRDNYKLYNVLHANGLICCSLINCYVPLLIIAFNRTRDWNLTHWNKTGFAWLTSHRTPNEQFKFLFCTPKKSLFCNWNFFVFVFWCLMFYLWFLRTTNTEKKSLSSIVRTHARRIVTTEARIR